MLTWTTHKSLLSCAWDTLASETCIKQKYYPQRKKYSDFEFPLVATVELVFGSYSAQIIYM